MAKMLDAICGEDTFEMLRKRAWMSFERAIECVLGEGRLFPLDQGELDAFLRCWLPYQAQRMVEDYARVSCDSVLRAYTDEATGEFRDIYFCMRTHLIVRLFVTRERLSRKRSNLRWHWRIDLYLPGPVMVEEFPELDDECGVLTKVDDTHLYIKTPEFARVRDQAVKDALSEPARPSSQPTPASTS